MNNVRPKKSTNKIIAILFIVVGLVGGYFYQSSFLSYSLNIISIPKIDSNLRSIDKIKFNLSVLEDDSFEALTIYGESPVNPGLEGKVDLFAPI